MARVPGPIDAARLEPVLGRSLAESRTLPAEAYTARGYLHGVATAPAISEPDLGRLRADRERGRAEPPLPAGRMI